MKTLIVLVLALSCDAVKFRKFFQKQNFQNLKIYIIARSFKLCNRTDPHLNECTREAAEYNIHQLTHPYNDLRVPGLKPLLIPTLTIGSGKRTVAVEQKFENCAFYGFENLEFKTFE